jgi:hypothetical protein
MVVTVMTVDRDEPSQELRDIESIPWPRKDRDIGIALSGGGHRATLFSLGALLYVVDSRANARVATISSVSGASILNAFVAQNCDFATVSQADFDRVSQSLLETLQRRPGLSWRNASIFAYMLLLLGSACGVFTVIVLGWPMRPPFWLSLLLVTYLAALLWYRGRVIEFTLDRSYFTNPRRTSQISFGAPSVGHVVCATDLVSGTPAYFLCGHEWWAYSPRFGFARDRRSRRPLRSKMRLSAAVRASTALPGLPPRLVRTRSLEWNSIWDYKWEPTSVRAEYAQLISSNEERCGRPRPPRWLALADGGLWNNLGTQYFERDAVPDVAFEVVKHRIPDRTPDDDPGKLVVVDASGSVKSSLGSQIFVPFWSEIWALLRGSRTLYANTVVPRLRQINETQRSYWRWGDQFDPDWDIPRVGVSIHFVDDRNAGRLYTGIKYPDSPHSNQIKAWAAECSGALSGLDERWPEFLAICRSEPTHLRRVTAEVAQALIAVGYVRTMCEMHSSFGTGVCRLDVSRLDALVKRGDQ